MDARNERDDRIPEEGGYGSPTPEEEMAPRNGEAAPVPREGGGEPHDGGPRAEPEPGTEEAPSTDADLDEANTEEDEHRESFSSESDEEASGLPDGGGTA